MARPDRLFRLLQALRTLPSPVTAAQLADETDVSVRSIYRDVESLRVAGAKIEGDRGYGYTIIEDGTLRPQAFSRIEIEALVLGLAEVRRMGDSTLSEAARSVLAKVTATMSSLGQQQIIHAISQVHGSEARYPSLPNMQLIREACWREKAMTISYTDIQAQVTTRTVWPLAVVYTDNVLVLLARCCLRDDFRMFRIDRITTAEATDISFRPQRVSLLRMYLANLRAL